jgi:anaphase-promoting complex subunit 2
MYLTSSCAKRLLHPAADTFTILAYYISTIKAFRMLDPPGVLLDKVARPIQIYLKYLTSSIFLIPGTAVIQFLVY